MARSAWYRLDNIGKFYSAEGTGDGQTVFRFCAAMDEEVDPKALQRALERTVERFPGFNVSLRSGLFWHYLEPASLPPVVQPERLPVCFGLRTGPRSTLFRVSWHGERVSLEVSHIIADGRGTYGFFQALIALYVEERYGTPAPEAAGAAEQEAQREDSFRRNYERDEATSAPAQRAFRLRGLRDEGPAAFLEYHLPVEPVLAWAHEVGVSVTSLVIAAVLVALRAQMAPGERGLPLRLTVPVDLRQFFGSTTMRNFFGLAFVSYVPGERDEPLDAIAREVQRQIVEGCSLDAVKGRMNRMVKLERNPLLRSAPLFLKDLALKVAAKASEREVTSTVSSLGRIEMPEGAAAHVRHVAVLTSTKGLNFVACTYGDTLTIGISTAFARLDVVRDLCRTFSAAGIHGFVDSNLDAADVRRREREGRLDDLVRQMAHARDARAGAQQ